MAISSFRNLSDIELCPVLVVLDRRCVPDAIRRIPLILPRLPNTPEWGVRIAVVLRELAVAWKPGLVRGLGIFGQAGKHYGHRLQYRCGYRCGAGSFRSEIHVRLQ